MLAAKREQGDSHDLDDHDFGSDAEDEASRARWHEQHDECQSRPDPPKKHPRPAMPQTSFAERCRPKRLSRSSPTSDNKPPTSRNDPGPSQADQGRFVLEGLANAGSGMERVAIDGWGCSWSAENRPALRPPFGAVVSRSGPRGKERVAGDATGRPFSQGRATMVRTGGCSAPCSAHRFAAQLGWAVQDLNL
jgi:hypothetical protein